MKSNSAFVLLVLFTLQVGSVNEVKEDMINERVVSVLVEEMTPDACNLFAYMCKIADKRQDGVHFDAESPWWHEAGFDMMDADARALFRRIHLHYDREVIFDEDGMVVFPRKKDSELA